MPPTSKSTEIEAIDPASLPNPALEVDRDSLNELFARDPEELTQADIAKIVPYYRERYKAFRLSETTKAKKKGAPKKTENPAAQISLDDLLGKPIA